MPEEQGPILPAREGGGAGPMPGNGAMGSPGRRTKRLRRLVMVFAVAGLVGLGFYLAVYLRTQAWQMGVSAGGVALGLVLALLALLVARREWVDAGGYLLLAAVAVLHLGGELAFSHATSYLLVSGTVLILAVGGSLLLRRWRTRLPVLVVFLLAALLVYAIEPIPRFDSRNSVLLRGYVQILLALSIGALIWRLVEAYQAIRTIRSRLVIASVASVLLTAAAISAGSIWVAVRNGQQQAIGRLELVVTLREVEIDDWVQDIQDTLASSPQQAPQSPFIGTEMANVVAALLDAPEDSVQRGDIYELLKYNFEQWQTEALQLDVVFLMDQDGEVLVSTDAALEGEVLVDETYFRRGTVGSYMAPLSYSQALGRPTLYASRPILGEDGRLLGVVAGRVDGSSLNPLMRIREQASLGVTGETYLVGTDGTMLTDSRFSAAGASVDTWGATAAGLLNEDGSGTYENYDGVRVIGVYRWLPDLEVALLAEQSRAEALSAVVGTAALNGVVSFVAVVFAAIGAVLIARRIGDPLSELADTASRIAAGDLRRTVTVERRDEIGTLAEAFNQMTAQLRGLIGRLESRVLERTRELELRSAYLEASAEVGRAASAVLDADELMGEVVGLIRQRFDLYYVGLFLLDEAGEWAELRSGTGEAGEEMLARGHRLRVGGQSMIGQCVARSEARIALDVGEEPVRFDNPLLPKTRSEAALPLESRGRVFGAITVQSTREAAFDQDVLTVLQTMADQVAVALDNAYLFEESQDALESARRAQVESTREAWADMLRFQPKTGYHSDERGVRAAGDVWGPGMEQAVKTGQTARVETTGSSEDGAERHPLAVPVKVAGKVIGVVDTYKPAEAGPWTEDEIRTIESLGEQLGASLESARLYQETQRRAARERLVAEISARLWASVDPDRILEATVQGLGQALGAEQASVELTGPLSGEDEAGSNGNVDGEEGSDDG